MTRRTVLCGWLVFGVMFFSLAAWQSPVQAGEKIILAVETSPNPKDSTNTNRNLENPPPGTTTVAVVTSVSDMVYKINLSLGEGDCIKELHIRGHAAPGAQGVGDGINWVKGKHINGGPADWWDQLKLLKGKFCPGATLYLWGCNVGSCDQGASKLKELADSLKVRVRGTVNTVLAGLQNSYDGPVQVASPDSMKPQCILRTDEKAPKKQGPTSLLFGSGTANGEHGYATLSWQMAVEVPVGGFVIERADSRDGDFVPLELTVSGATGSRYSCTDYSVSQGRTYWYKIGLASSSGMEEYGPIEVYVAKFPVAYRTYQSYPNPFNPVCTIRYDIPRADRVSLRVLDVRGTVVRTLVDGWREPGMYSEVWDGRSDEGSVLPSGVYFYSIKAGDFVATRKMVLLK